MAVDSFTDKLAVVTGGGSGSAASLPASWRRGAVGRDVRPEPGLRCGGPRPRRGRGAPPGVAVTGLAWLRLRRLPHVLRFRDELLEQHARCTAKPLADEAIDQDPHRHREAPMLSTLPRCHCPPGPSHTNTRPTPPKPRPRFRSASAPRERPETFPWTSGARRAGWPVRVASALAELFLHGRQRGLQGKDRAGQDVRRLEAHEVVFAPAQFRIGGDAVRVPEPGAFQLVADATGVGERGWPIRRVR